MPWLPLGTIWETTDWTCKTMYRDMYDKEPDINENVYCMNKAGIVLKALVAMCPPPTKLTREDWLYLSRAEHLMCEKDICLSYPLSITMSSVRNMNPHLFVEQEKKDCVDIRPFIPNP